MGSLKNTLRILFSNVLKVKANKGLYVAKFSKGLSIIVALLGLIVSSSEPKPLSLGNILLYSFIGAVIFACACHLVIGFDKQEQWYQTKSSVKIS